MGPLELRRFGLLSAAVVVVLAGRPAVAGESEQTDESRDRSTNGETDSKDSASGGEQKSRKFEWESEDELFEVEDPEDESGEESGREDRERRRQPRVPISEMSKDEARRAGFEFGGNTRASKRLEAVLMGATGGLLVHGAGNWYSRKGRAASFLLATEGVGIVLGTAGLLTLNFGEDAPAAVATGTRLFHTGASLFALSYVLDLVGAVRAGGGEVAGRTGADTGITIEAGYEYLSARGYPLNHHFHAAVQARFGRFFGEASTDQDFGLDGSNYELELGARLFEGNRPATHAYVLLGGGHESFRDTGPFDAWRAEARLGGSIDLGLVASHLEGVALGLEAGYGRSWYQGTAPTPSPPAPSLDYVPVEVFTSFQVTRRVRTLIEFEQTPTRRLRADSELIGVGRLAFVYDSSDLFDLEVGGEAGIGGGFSVFGNLLVDVM